MFVIVIAMLVILGLAAAVYGLVAVGMQGRHQERAPELASRLRRAARHLNGEAEPPEPVQRFVERHLSKHSR